MEIPQWLANEMSTINLGDTRLDKRCATTINELSSDIERSVASSCHDKASAKGAYRLMSNPKASMEKIMQPHVTSVQERIAQEKVVVIAQDTTELEFTGQPVAKHLGALCDKYRPGFLFHPSIAFTLDKVCLGVVGYKIWTRDTDGETTRNKRKQLPITEKESNRWVEGYQIADGVAQMFPDTLVICVADRECDMYDLFSQADGACSHWNVRAYQNRSLTEKDPDTKASYKKVWDHVSKQPERGTVSFHMSERKGRAERDVTQNVRCARVELKPPHRKFEKLKPVIVNAVMIREQNTPKGETPVDWLLLTSLPIETWDDLQLVIHSYLCRWQIECFFKALKHGCKVENIHLETPERVQSCLAMYIIIAWRILFMTMLCRVKPDAPCTVVFCEAEWKSLMTIQTRSHRHKAPPRLLDMVKRVASLGSYQGRKGDGFPGIGAIWDGLKRLSEYTEAWNAFGPQADICG